MFPLLCLFVVLVVSNLGFEDRNLVLIASVPGHCIAFSLSRPDLEENRYPAVP